MAKIEQIDKNFATEQVGNEVNKEEYILPHSQFSLYGVRYDEGCKRFARMDVSVAEKVGETLGLLAQRSSP